MLHTCRGTGVSLGAGSIMLLKTKPSHSRSYSLISLFKMAVESVVQTVEGSYPKFQLVCERGSLKPGPWLRVQ